MSASSPPPNQTPLPPPPIPSIPTKRSIEDDHTPSISSPLNPDPKPRPMQREQREKKDSLKKREAAGFTASPPPSKALKGKKSVEPAAIGGQPSPVRYNHPLPGRDSFHYGVRDVLLGSCEEPVYQNTSAGAIELKRPIDQPENKKMYRYTHCAADPTFKHMRYYRATDDKPYGARMSFVDSDKNIVFNDAANIIRNEKGWRMSRSNVCVREGSFYYEVKVLNGVPAEGPAIREATAGRAQPHIRAGWSRREAPLDAPVGFDGYSYGVTDIRMEPMHKSRMSKFLDNGVDLQTKKKASKVAAKGAKPAATQQPQTTEFEAQDSFREGDVIGMLIKLPSLGLHRKVVEGNYNPAVDVGDGFDAPDLDTEAAPNIVRDRFPVPYRSTMYFETMEYKASKGMESYGDRGPFQKEAPTPNHDDPTLRCLPASSVKIFKNGKMVGTAFRNLMAFLPPASLADKSKDAKDKSFDDGMAGYYPTIAVFGGGVAEMNFGPAFWHPPEGLNESTLRKVVKKEDDTVMGGTEEDGAEAESFVAPSRRKGIRATSERYDEQIVEDIVYDLVDEIDFYIQDKDD